MTAAGWAIIDPEHNRILAELAVKDTGLGNVPDKIVKNHRKTLGLLRDLQGAISTDVIATYPGKGITEFARPAAPARNLFRPGEMIDKDSTALVVIPAKAEPERVSPAPGSGSRGLRPLVRNDALP